MNKSNIYDRNLFKKTFKDLYNDKNIDYDFPLNDNFLSNIISKWKNNSIRFIKSVALKEIKDYENRLILREYRNIPLENNSKIKISSLEYIIWANSENLKRIKVSKNLFVDGTFHHPPEFYQLLIIMYKDVITNLKLPGIYILLNSKTELIYDLVFESLIKIIWYNNLMDIKVETIVTDQELALIKVIKKYFPNARRISCLFHCKQNILRNLRVYGLMKKNKKEESLNLLKKLGNISFVYKGKLKM